MPDVLMMTANATNPDASFLPPQSRLDLLLTDASAPPKLTVTAFLVPFLPDGRIVLARNMHRGGRLEIPGGHIESRETAEVAALREKFEEVGCVVVLLVAIALERCVLEGPCPDGYRYPYPVSFQTFYAAIVTDMSPYVENSECGQPVVLDVEDFLASEHHGIGSHAKTIVRHAETVMKAAGFLPPEPKMRVAGEVRNLFELGV